MTQLSDHFSVRELTFSETAARMGHEVEPSPAQLANLKRLCVELLEPIRTQLGRPIVVSSGLRPPWLNVLVGGSMTSAHMDGLAADINAVGMSPSALARWIKNQGFAVDQVIEEFGRWVHVSVNPTGVKPRNQYLTASKVSGETVYGVLA